ncbi:unnamed protein product [Ixodes persulcatus]
MIMRTPKQENAKRYSQLREIQLGTQTYIMAAYVTAPENTSKGAIHGIPDYDLPEDIQRSLVIERNPGILHARRMGKTGSAVIVFEGTRAPHYVYYCGAEYRCQLYKKHETCNPRGRLGHRADVCPSPDNKKCRGCGAANPPEDHKCDPRCTLCGKGHLTGDKKYRKKFKTPYLLRKRQWETQQQQRQEEQQQQKPPADGRPSRSRERTDTARSSAGTGTGGYGSGSSGRSRSRSFPRLPGGGDRSNYRTRSKSQPRSRRKSGSRTRGPSFHGSREIIGSGGNDKAQLSWADTVSGTASSSIGRSALEQDMLQVRKLLEQVIRENTKQRDEIQKLREEYARLQQNRTSAPGHTAPFNQAQTSSHAPTPVSEQSAVAPPHKRKAEEENETDNAISTQPEKKAEDMLAEISKTIQQQFAQLHVQFLAIRQQLTGLDKRMDSVDIRLTAVENEQRNPRPMSVGPVKTTSKPYSRPVMTEPNKATGENQTFKHCST